MGTVLSGDVVLIKAVQRLGSEKVINTFYVLNDGPGNSTDETAKDAALAWLQTAYGFLPGSLTPEWSTDIVQFYNMTQDRPMGDEPWNSTITGTGGSESMPYQMAALVTFPTEVKRSLGKKYIAGFTEGDSPGAGVLGPAPIANLVSFAAEILSGFNQSANLYAVGNYREALGTFIPYVSALVDVLLSTQRRRKPGIGE